MPSAFTATSVSWNQRSFPCDIVRWKSVRHSVHWIGRLSLRASRQQATSCGCDVILLPKPPPMSCVTKRSLSRPVRIAGPIMIAAKPGNWLFVWIVHCPVPRLNSTSAPSHSRGVELKRSKWSSLILTTESASAKAASTSPHSYTPLHERLPPVSSCSCGASGSSALRASTSASSGSYSTSTSSEASRASSRVSATTIATGSPTWRTLPTASA